MPVAYSGMLLAENYFTPITSGGTYSFPAFTVPVGTTALLTIEEQFNSPQGEFTLTDSGRTWTLVGTIDNTEGRVWVWGWQNSGASAASPTVVANCPTTVDFAPVGGRSVIGYTGAADPAVTAYPVTKNPAGAGRQTGTNTRAVAMSTTQVGSLPTVVFAFGDGPAIGTAQSGSTLASSEGGGGGNIYHGVYVGQVTAATGAVTVGETGTTTSTKNGLLGVEVLPSGGGGGPLGSVIRNRSLVIG